MLDNILALHSGIWTANRLYQSQTHCRPSGHDIIDEKLEGGWPESGVVELQLPCFGIGELRLVFPAIASALKDSELVVFATPPGELNPIALCQANLDLNKVVILHSSLPSTLWCIEQAIKSGCCRTAVLWGKSLSVTQARRLQLAATENDCLLFMFTHQASTQGLPVSCRLAVSPSEDGLNVRVVKRRGLPIPPFHLPLPAIYHAYQRHISHQDQEKSFHATASSIPSSSPSSGDSTSAARNNNVVPLFR